MDIFQRKAVPRSAEGKGGYGTHRGIDRPGARLGDPANRDPPEEVRKKKL